MNEKKYEIKTEDVAVPEVHTGKIMQGDEDKCGNDEVVYEPLAVPEIHIHRKKKKGL